MADSSPEIPSDYVCPTDGQEEILNECESIWKHMEEESQKDKLLTVLRDCCAMHACQSKLMLQGTETLLKSDVKADSSPEIPSDYVCPTDGQEEILNECESIWKHMEEESQKDKLLTVLRDCCAMHACQSKLMLQGTETLLKSDVKLTLLIMQVKTLTAEYCKWQKRSPELTSTNPDVLLILGKEELQKVKNDLETILSKIKSKNKQLEKDLKREQQWHEEQEQLLNTLNGIEEETKTQVQLSKKRLNNKAFHELQKEMLKLKMHKNELLNALGGFLEEHFPLPEKGGSARMKNSSEEPAVELITLNEILEILINKLMRTPHEPYVVINDSFWPPYVELLLRHGIALRHPEDPNRLRLEAFHM